MGLFQKLSAHFGPSTSRSEIPDQTIIGVSISSPRPAVPGQGHNRPDGLAFLDPGEEEVYKDMNGNTVLPPGYETTTTPPRKARPDPRRPKRKGRSSTSTVLIMEVVCSSSVVPLCTIATLGRLDKVSYETVIPHLYRRIHINRHTLPSLLYNIPLPNTGYVFDADAIYDVLGKKKQVYRPLDGVSKEAEGRKRKCLGYVREVVVDGFLPDWQTCKSLSLLRAVRATYAPDTKGKEGGQGVKKASEGDGKGDTERAGSNHELDPPAYDAGPSKSGNPMGGLMPNIETIHFTPEAIASLVSWEETSKSPHILLEALVALCGHPVITFGDPTLLEQPTAEAGKEMMARIESTFR